MSDVEGTLRNVSAWTRNSLKASSWLFQFQSRRSAQTSARESRDDSRQRCTEIETKKSAISRIENHAEDIRLSAIQKYARALGKNLRVEVIG
jgi:hypothetical protein